MAVAPQRPLMSDEQADMIAKAIRVIAHGGLSGPTGLEALAMSLAGEGSYGSSNNLASVIGEAVRAGLGEIARAVEQAGVEIAEALTQEKG